MFITHGKNRDLVEPIRKLLEYGADIACNATSDLQDESLVIGTVLQAVSIGISRPKCSRVSSVQKFLAFVRYKHDLPELGGYPAASFLEEGPPCPG
ncbi:MAG TPA: hypothetical protein VF745_00875 [Steroidobacteraceae bacterium]